MRILISGASGQIGSALVARLKGSADVVATNRCTLDLSRPHLISGALDRLEPDFIINAAAYTDVDKAEDERELAQIINGDAPGEIADWAALHRVPLIHFSTDYVFDGSRSEPWQEPDAAVPLSVYGSSKLAGEKGVRSAQGRHLIVRTSWIYSASGKNFLRTIARLAGSVEEIRVVADQVGSPTSAAMVANSIAAMLNHPKEFCSLAKQAGGLVHLTATGETTWYDFATEIVAGLRRRDVALTARRVVPIRTGEYSSFAKRPLNSRLCLERLRDVFGIIPPHWSDVLVPELDELVRETQLERP